MALAFSIKPTRYTRGMIFSADLSGFAVVVYELGNASNFHQCLSGLWFGRFDNGARFCRFGWIGGKFGKKLYGVRQ